MEPSAIDFDADILVAVRGLLPSDVQGRQQLDHMSADEAWLAYGNWLARQVPPSPRRLYVSRELVALLPRHSDQGAVRAVLAEIEQGVDLGPRLSKDTRCFYDAQHERRFASRGIRDLKHRRDLDLLLNDWGVHHLHLGTVAGGERYAQRSKNVLLVSFTPDSAYVIMVTAGHSGWADEKVLRIMADNWPDSGMLLGSITGLRLAQAVDPADRQALREAGVNVFYEHRDGRVYSPRGMLSLAGTSLNLGLARDPSMALVRSVQRALAGAPPNRLDAFLRSHDLAVGVSPSRATRRTRWHLEVVEPEHAWALCERSTQSVISLAAVEAFLLEHPAGHSCLGCEPVAVDS